ncbi:WRKY transcription factor 22-like [Bidens hawaiensis]|uniref:WRKY transcription factor 22-like n=1 Tax=Bidens hawaiensis TaxID=980011 RepID=UPI00404B3B89
MDNEWDLHAVVRSCSAPNTASSAAMDAPPVAGVGTTEVTLISFDGRSDHEQPSSTFSNLISFSMQDSEHHGRKRKSKNDRKVVEMREEEVSNDGWAWRKYGQKPIKGSPYERCSTTKDCSARKRVERSPADGSTFIVSYSGNHLHPRPTRLSSLAGTTRSATFSPVATGLPERPACSSSSQASTSSFSPATSLKEDETEMNDEDVQEVKL